MGFQEHIRKTVGRPKATNPLRELQTLNENLRSLGVNSRPQMPDTFESLWVKLARRALTAPRERINSTPLARRSGGTRWPRTSARSRRKIRKASKLPPLRIRFRGH